MSGIHGTVNDPSRVMSRPSDADVQARGRAAAGLAAPREPGRFQHLQALEDAIKYRRARIAGQCGDCGAAPDGRCVDHGRDVDLIGEYERTARRLLLEAGS